MSVHLFTNTSVATLAALALGLIGCSQSPPRADAPLVAVPTSEAQPISGATPSIAQPPIADGAEVSLTALLEMAERISPNRQVFEANRAAAAATVRQTRAWSNPELEINLGRAQSREANDDGVHPTTATGGLSLKQRFELPSKRSARINAAEIGRNISEREAALDHLELDLEIRSAALAMASANARVAQAERGIDLSAQVRTAVERRVQAGETDRGDLARAQVDLANAQLATEAASAEAMAARAALRIWCGDVLPEHFTITGILSDMPATIILADVQHRTMAAHPRLAMSSAQQAVNVATITAEERAWYPDLTVGVSSSRESDTNDVGVSVGLELPLWNRNEGGIAKAHADLARLKADQHKELLALQRQLIAAWNAYERERKQIAGLSGAVIPAAQDALRLKLTAFQAGDATLLDLIDVRRAVFSAEAALTDSRERAAAARIELIRAMGTDPLDPPQPRPSSSSTSKPSTAPAGVQP